MGIENDIVKRYFDAWDKRNADAIVATFMEGGTYYDPATTGEIAGEDIAKYAQTLFDAFPDMSVELISNVAGSHGAVAAPWLIYGTHDGVLMGNQPTGKRIVLQGCDFMKIEDGLLESVVGLWDADDLFRQLGLSD